MKIGETISYKGYTIKRGIGIRPYYVKECGLFVKTEKQAKDFIDSMGKDAITINLKDIKII